MHVRGWWIEELHVYAEYVYTLHVISHYITNYEILQRLIQTCMRVVCGLYTFTYIEYSVNCRILQRSRHDCVCVCVHV